MSGPADIGLSRHLSGDDALAPVAEILADEARQRQLIIELVCAERAKGIAWWRIGRRILRLLGLVHASVEQQRRTGDAVRKRVCNCNGTRLRAARPAPRARRVVIEEFASHKPR